MLPRPASFHRPSLSSLAEARKTVTGLSGRSDDARVPCRRKDASWGRQRRSTASSWRAGSEGADARARRPTRRTLIRRATFDLIGLPPTPEEVDGLRGRRLARGLRDASSTGCWPRRATASAGAGTGSTWPAMPTPRATSSPRSGAIPYAYTYRDYVIRAFNEDMPYDRFVLRAARRRPACRWADDSRPLAGAGLPDAGPAVPQQQPRHHRRPDRRGHAAACMGLTVACARCHDHKFDPIPTRTTTRSTASSPARSSRRTCR